MAQTLRRRDLFFIPFALACPTPVAASPDPQTSRADYRIDVTIAPFGITIFSRKEVGYGAAQLRVHHQDGRRMASFEFGGASIPERTRGIRQIGYFEEELSESGYQVHSSRYFGFISSAPEGAPSKATLALATDTNAKVQYCCAVEGHLADGRTGFTKTYEAPLPTDASFATLPGLRHVMRRALASICATSCLNGTRAANPGKTFLSVLAEAALGPSSALKTSYQYGDRVLKFESTRRDLGGQVTVDAEVQGKSRHRFSFTCSGAHRPELPSRIDYQPKPWLRLTLVAVAGHAPSKEST